MKKSQTGIVLPTINSKAKFGSQLRQVRLSSCFVQKVKQEVTKEEEYQVMDDGRLGEQQQKLKRLLRDFNDHSQFVLANFIDGPLRSSRTQSSKKNESVQAKQKQFTVLSKMMQQCQTQLRVLQGRCQNLKYLTRQQMQRQISEVSRQIETLRTENKDMTREVTLNGLNFTRAEKNGEVKNLEAEKLQLELKKNQLQTNSDESIKELQAFKERFAAQQKQSIEKELQFKQAMQIQASFTNADKLKQQHKQKKKLIEQMGQRNQQHNGVIKQRYYTRLRQLQQLTGSRKKTDQQIGKKQILLQKSKKDLIILEHQLSALKHGTTTIQLLQAQIKKT